MQMTLSCPHSSLQQLYTCVVTRPSKGAEGVMIAFGAIFASAGLFSIGAYFLGRVQGTAWVALIVGGTFVIVGSGLVYAAVAGMRKLREQSALQQSNPGSPWLWRKDWAASRAESRNRNSAAMLWFVAIFANLIVISVAAANLPKLWGTSDPKALFVLGFCFAGLILLGAAVRASLRRKRFGETYFEFAALPFSPGRALKGTIHLRFNTSAPHGIDLSLACVRQVITGSDKERNTMESILWQADKNIPQEYLAPGPTGNAQIPVDFTIPSDAYESNHDHPDDQVLWLLHARADVPGVNYSDDFEVPVFRLTPSALAAAEPVTRFASDAQEAAAPAFQSDSSDVAAPPNPKVIVSVGMDGGTEFYFPAFRNPARVLGLFLFTSIWTSIVYFLLHSHAPWIFAAVFGFFDLLLVYALIRSALVSTRIQVGNGRIAFRRSLLGIGAKHELPFAQVAQILPVTTMQQKGAKATYSVRMQTKNGIKLTLADGIDSRQEARWITAELEKLAGLQLDTHVAVTAGFGTSSPPPQRGQSRPAPSTFRQNGPLASAIGLAIFLVWAGVIGYQIFGHRPGVKRLPYKPASRAKVNVNVNVPAQPSLQPVNYSPLTDADLQHLQTLPDQSQAEELLDRAIRHDYRALEVFEQNIGLWSGLQRTAQIQELERKSSFSTDLRVRYANVDLNLALDGWPKTETSADQLLAQAQADAAHRPYSVYHLGMLAGRGVAYGRIYPILLDYAKRDPNPQVRQWAVEGMRFLGTGEALQQLFDSFANDPSASVRDRAGCNVSDCGNFMRKQRMRMVPQLIALAADPQTAAQTRSWTFLALHEITDATVPSDAPDWQKWYDQHGAEKMAEFEHADWWQVRGDQ